MASEEHESPKQEENTDPILVMQGSYCCCFHIFSSNRTRTVGSKSWDKVRTAAAAAADDEERWWSGGARAVMKFREWSEIVAGPKWKTFIRRFNRNRSFGSAGRHRKFQYDPLSYSLNFDQGHGQNGQFDEDDAGDDYGGVRDFSSRYASVAAVTVK